MKKQQPWCVWVCIDFPQQNRFFGPSCRLRGQNKSPLCEEVMMVLQRQLCCCYTAATWWHRLGLRTACSAKRAPFLLQESESWSWPSDAGVWVWLTLVLVEGKHWEPRKPYHESHRKIGQEDLQISYQTPSSRRQRIHSLLGQSLAAFYQHYHCKFISNI